MPQPAASLKIFEFTPAIIKQRYPYLPAWALAAFHEIKYSGRKPYRLSPEARALLNIAILPMPGYKYGRDNVPLLDVSIKSRDLFGTQKSWDDNKEHVDLCRFSCDILKLMEGNSV
jgi:hypothetical protein